MRLGPLTVSLNRPPGRMVPILERATFGDIQAANVGTLFGNDGVGPEWALSKYGEYYAKSVPAYRAIKLRADAVASAPLRVYRRRGDDVPEALPSDAPVQSLLDHVNPYWTSADLWKATETYLSLWGSCFWFLDRDGRTGGLPTNIWLLRPDMVRIIPDRTRGPTNAYIKGFLFDAGGKREALLPEEIVWFRYFNPLDEYAGLAPIAAGRLSLDMGRDALQFNRSFFANGALPQDLVFTVSGPVDQQEVDAFYERLDKRHKGPTRAHRPMIWDLSNGGEPKSLGLTQRDMEFVQGLNFTVEEASRIWGVPPPKMYSQVQSVYNNVRQADVEFYTDTISNEWSFLASEVNELFIPLTGEDDLFVAFDTSKILPLQEAQFVVHETQRADVAAGIITINEVRKARNLDEVPWGDIWWAPISVAPPGEGPSIPLSMSITDRAARGFTVRSVDYDERSLAAIGLAFDRRRDKQERSFQAMQVSLFERQRKETLRQLQEAMRNRSIVERQLPGEVFDVGAWLKIFTEAGLPAMTRVLVHAAQQHATSFNLGTFDPKSPAIAAWVEGRVAFWAAAVNEGTARLLMDELTEGIAAGESIKHLQDRIEGVFDFNNQVRSETIARTESLAASNQGHLELYEQSGVVEQKMWLAVIDDRTREEHIAAHKQTVPLSASFIVGGEMLAAPGLGGSAENIINCRCLPRDTVVDWANIQRVFRRWYEGELIELTTALGYKLSGTPNHPVLTDTGWLALGHLREGDYVISRRLGEWVPLVDPNINHMPSQIGQIFDALALTPALGRAERVGSTPMQFHGDGGEGEVHVITLDNPLSIGKAPSFLEQTEQFKLTFPHRKMGLSCHSASLPRVQKSPVISQAGTPSLDISNPESGSDYTPAGLKGPGKTEFRLTSEITSYDQRIIQPQFGSARITHVFGADLIPLRSVPEEPPGFENSAHAERANMMVAANGFNAIASQIIFDRVVDIRRGRFADHVYNLETESGWFLANGIITHNCTIVPVIAPSQRSIPVLQNRHSFDPAASLR